MARREGVRGGREVEEEEGRGERNGVGCKKGKKCKKACARAVAGAMPFVFITFRKF